jgi:hypothetical protein
MKTSPSRLALLLIILIVLFSTEYTRAEDGVSQGVTAVIDIGNRPVAIEVDDLPSCLRVIANRINNLKMLSQDSLTAADVTGQCFGRDGRLLASGRCGVKMIGQMTRLCVPQMQ